MRSSPLTLDLPPSVFRILRDLIEERTGLFYDDAKRPILADKLSPYVVARGFTSFLDFYYLLRYGPTPADEWLNMMDALSVQETYFWRELAQIQALVEDVLPRVMEKNPSRTVKIWCAACATGEEPLTIAMALAEAGWFERADIRIRASDASPSALGKAQQGVYRDRSFRTLPAHLKSKYFSTFEQGYRINRELHSRIEWSLANLVQEAEIAKLANASIIFCRNVFIYFSDETIAQIVDSFARAMLRPGHLFVGAAESLLNLTDEFELEETQDAFVYSLK